MARSIGHQGPFDGLFVLSKGLFWPHTKLPCSFKISRQGKSPQFADAPQAPGFGPLAAPTYHPMRHRRCPRSCRKRCRNIKSRKTRPSSNSRSDLIKFARHTNNAAIPGHFIAEYLSGFKVSLQGKSLRKSPQSVDALQAPSRLPSSRGTHLPSDETPAPSKVLSQRVPQD